jgi:aminoglycoside N3'-acetyltransferase
LNMIRKQLENTGVLPRMSLEVHSSYKKINTDISPEEIINDLKSIITIEGNLVMPTFPLSKKMAISENDKKLGILTKSKWLPDEHIERTDMGIISDTFRLAENVLTGSGRHRMSAWGKNSKEITDDLNF